MTMDPGIQNTKYLKRNTQEYIWNTFWNTKKLSIGFTENDFLHLYSEIFAFFSWKNIFSFTSELFSFFRIHLEKVKREVVLDPLFLYSKMYSYLYRNVFQMYSYLYTLYSAIFFIKKEEER